jgi:hypothetical protein
MVITAEDLKLVLVTYASNIGTESGHLQLKPINVYSWRFSIEARDANQDCREKGFGRAFVESSKSRGERLKRILCRISRYFEVGISDTLNFDIQLGDHY